MHIFEPGVRARHTYFVRLGSLKCNFLVLYELEVGGATTAQDGRRFAYLNKILVLAPIEALLRRVVSNHRYKVSSVTPSRG
jgi:hypothetical protein